MSKKFNPLAAIGTALGGALGGLVSGMSDNHRDAPPVIQAAPVNTVTPQPAPVDAAALETARLADLENQRRKNQQSLRIDLANPSQGGTGLSIPT